MTIRVIGPTLDVRGLLLAQGELAETPMPSSKNIAGTRTLGHNG